MATPRISTYGQLVTAVGAGFLNRGDLAGSIPDFVALAEAAIRRSDVERTVETTLDVSTAETDLPTDFRRLQSVYHNGPQYSHDIRIMTPQQLSPISLAQVNVGVPVAGAVVDSDGTYKLRLAPTPGSTMTLAIIYDADFTPLDSADNTSTNWILQSYPDVYLYGVLTESAPFLRDDERLPMWQTRFASAMEDLRVALQKRKWSTTPLVIRPKRVLGE